MTYHGCTWELNPPGVVVLRSCFNSLSRRERVRVREPDGQLSPLTPALSRREREVLKQLLR
jgi:hypothetical protein